MRYAGRALQAVLLAGVSMVAAAATTHVIQSYDSYRSWFVTCDNGLHCVAKGFSQSDAGAEIAIDRDAGPAGQILVSIRSDRPFTLSQVSIDGTPAALSSSAWTLQTTDGTTTASSQNLTAIQHLIARLRRASTVTLGANASVPLDGLVAAVVRLDERQARIGSVTALAATGRLPASSVRLPPLIPRIPARPIADTLSPGEGRRLVAAVQAQQRGVFAAASCETNPNGMAPQAHALDHRDALVFVPCLQGAYQSASLGFIVSRLGHGSKRLVLPLRYEGNGLGDDRGQRQVDLFTEEAFDPRTGMLSTATKGRALGDCGLSAAWVWNGSDFVLTELALQQSCGGIADDWPVLFRSTRQ